MDWVEPMFTAIGFVCVVMIALGIVVGIVATLIDRHSDAVADAKLLDELRDRVANMPDPRTLEQMHADCRLLSRIREVLVEEGGG